MGILRSVQPTRAEIQQRSAELLEIQAGLNPQPQQAHSALLATEPEPPSAPDELQLDQAALYGLAGLAVQTLAPHTEAHPAAILLQLLVAFGNLVGPGPHCMVDATRHGLNLFVVLVGESSKARKGTSWSQIARLLAEVDSPWLDTRVTTARLTPGGLFYAVRDQQPAPDRRLLALSEEFASVLHTMGRTKGQLSPLLRCAWDSGHLRTLDRHQTLQATGAHVSLIAHITERELDQHLHPTEAHNGFANRCLWIRVQRSQCLPEGGSLGSEERSAVARELRRALDWANTAPAFRFTRDEAARQLWNDCYPALSQAHPGLYGAATSRAEAQVLRLSAIYAVLDCSPIITLPHLEAALAVWDYCSSSASVLFGNCTGNPTADRIMDAVNASPDGLSRKQIGALFHGHLASDRIEAALEQLMSLGIINHHTQPGRGRPMTLWSATPEGESADQESIAQEPVQEGT
jgi:hypothetical protein